MGLGFMGEILRFRELISKTPRRRQRGTTRRPSFACFGAKDKATRGFESASIGT
jgi:hypothetical protein